MIQKKALNGSQLDTGTLKALVKDAVSSLGPEYSKEDKLTQAKLLMKIVTEGKTPREILKLSDEDICHLYSFANSLFNSGKYDEARVLFRMLYMYDPLQTDFTMALAVCHHKLKEYDKALNLYKEAGQRDLLNPLPSFYAYDCCCHLGVFVAAGVMLCQTIARCDEPKYDKLKHKAELLLEQLGKDIAEKKAA